jgi:type IV pilus assembly protein PilV
MKRLHTTPTVHPAQHGYSLIEVLIALAVLSIGLLGLAALQTASLRVGHDSYQRTQATLLAYDMADRMRANRAGVTAGNYITVGANKDCTQLVCNASELAAYDITSWNTALSEKLSQGQGTIAFNNATSIHTITVRWNENDLTMQLTLDVQI